MQTRNNLSVTTPQPPIDKIFSTPQFPSTHAQQENEPEILSAFDNLVTSQNIEYHYPQATTTQVGVETVIENPLQYLHPSINALADLAKPYTAMTTSTSAITAIPSFISEHTPLLIYYDSDLSSSMLQQLLVKR